MALGGMYILIFFCGEIQCIVRKPLCYCRCKFKILTNPSPALFTIDATIMAFQSLPVAPRSMIGGYLVLTFSEFLNLLNSVSRRYVPFLCMMSVILCRKGEECVMYSQLHGARWGKN